MADRCDERNGKPERGLDHFPLVEGPEILARSAAAREDHGVKRHGARRRKTRGGPQRARDLADGGLALHAHVDHDELDGGAALDRGLADILERGTRCARDDRDPTRMKRQRLLAPLCERAARAELLDKRAEAPLEVADTLLLDLRRIELRLAVGRVVADLPRDDDRVTFVRAESHARSVALPHHAWKNAVGVLDREVPVAPHGQVGDLPHDAVIAAKAVLERAGDQLGERGDCELARRLLAHGVDPRLNRRRCVVGLRRLRTPHDGSRVEQAALKLVASRAGRIERWPWHGVV